MNNTNINKEQVLQKLCDLKTIRSQAQAIHKLAQQNRLAHFSYHPEQLPATAAFVIEVMQAQYPDFIIPYHSRWRHFEAGNLDRISALLASNATLSKQQAAAMCTELVVLSVFLDAGAGSKWTYWDDETQRTYTRSEGLALASLALYQSGVLSKHPDQPLRIDAEALLTLNASTLAHYFQINPTNPLEGVEGRLDLLRQLGLSIKQHPYYFGQEGRLGDFFYYLASLAQNNCLSAAQIFQAVLEAFHSIWPPRLVFEGVSLGDVWIHSKLKNDALGSEYIPFHKLSQWLSYSLIEPLEQAGIAVTELDALTGLPEYRNGGLFIDTGVLQVKNKQYLVEPQEPSSEAIIEWRALTVALLDELAKLIRIKLQLDEHTLPLAKILQGGTWEAGRRIAALKRPQGLPPIQIISDGTVF